MIAKIDKNRPYLFYSVFPPLLIIYAIGSVWGGSTVLSGILIVLNVLVNILLFLAILLLSLWFTKNSPRVTFLGVLTISAVVVILSDTYSFFANPLLLFHSYMGPIPPLSQYLPPKIYNTITQILIPGAITFATLYLMLKSRKTKRLIIVCVVTTLLTLPWSYYTTEGGIEPRKGSNLSLKQIENLQKQITPSFIAEEIVPDPNSTEYNMLRIKGKISVPSNGKFTIFPIVEMVRQPKKDPTLYDPPPYTVIVNGNPDPEIDGVPLIKGENALVLEIPYVFYRRSGEVIINLPMQTSNVKDPYGPYKIRLQIRSFQPNEKQTIPLGLITSPYITNPYITKEYRYTEFYRSNSY